VAGTSKPVQIRGRGASDNPPNRFERLAYERDPDSIDPEEPSPQTVFLRDASRSFIAYNDSPDVGFDASINPYRGCEHGCIYCYARPTHEYLGMSAGIDFETRILVKEDGPKLLRQELESRNWTPQVIAISGVTDAYQPAERRFKLTRACLQVLLEFRNPVMIVTKNHLVTRDADILRELAAFDAATVFVSITTLDPNLAGAMEPRASTPALRLAAIDELKRAGVPVGVMAAPVIPGLNDHEIAGIIKEAAAAGAQYAGYVMMRLPHGVKELFEDWLERNYPARFKKVLNRVRDVRGGNLNDPRFRSRMKGEGVFAEQVRAMFHIASKKAGIAGRFPTLSTASFRRPAGPQLILFDQS
jgi:DNA repair photolyase